MNIIVDSESIEVALHPEFSFYAASKDGRVFTRPAIISRKGIPRGSVVPRCSHWAEVSQFTVQPEYTPPYRKCRITQGGKTKIVSVHRFMLECWVGVMPRTIVVRHLDGKSLHNHLDNLTYGTVRENVKDAFDHIGNYAQGSRNGRATLSEHDVSDIRRRFDSGESVASIHRDYLFVSKPSVANAAKRLTWTHIP